MNEVTTESIIKDMQDVSKTRNYQNNKIMKIEELKKQFQPRQLGSHIEFEKVMSEIGEISLQAKAPLILKKGGRFSAESGLNEGEIKNLRGIEDDLDINGYSQEKLIQHAYTLSCDYIAVPKVAPGTMMGIDAPTASLPGYEMFGEFGFFSFCETDGYVIFKRG